MPHNLANIQPPLTGSSLSLEEPGGKGKPAVWSLPSRTGTGSSTIPGPSMAMPVAGGPFPTLLVVQQPEGNATLLSWVLCVHPRDFNLFEFPPRSALQNAKGNLMP